MLRPSTIPHMLGSFGVCCVLVSICIQVVETTKAAVASEDSYCHSTPQPGHSGNCACEVAGEDYACAQSFESITPIYDNEEPPNIIGYNIEHAVYMDCMPMYGMSCIDTSTVTPCGQKYKCVPACDDPDRDCISQPGLNCPYTYIKCG